MTQPPMLMLFSGGSWKVFLIVCPLLLCTSLVLQHILPSNTVYFVERLSQSSKATAIPLCRPLARLHYGMAILMTLYAIGSVLGGL